MMRRMGRERPARRKARNSPGKLASRDRSALRKARGRATLHKARDRRLSELEGCILGTLWLRGASTAYAVRRVFLDSPSSHWSGSAGAVYPALERLENLELVDSEHASRGDREAWRYALTSAGRRRFLTWLEPPFPEEIVSLPPDPLRTRLSFIGMLTPARRAEFFAASAAALREMRKLWKARRSDDENECWAYAAAIDAMRARLEWFERASRQARSGGRAIASTSRKPKR
jgi:DNA-binding PadR family transcriptional regulator